MTEVTPGPDGRAGAPVAFSTVGLPEDRSVELWEAHNADALIGLRCRTLTARALEATEINVRVDRVHLARVRGTPHVVERDADLIRRTPTESVALFFSLAGEAFFYHDDGVRTVQPGQLLVCDTDRPFMRGFSHGLEELVLKMPRSVFADATGIDRIDRPLLMSFGGGANAFAEALARRVGAAARDGDASPPAERDLLGLVAALGGRGHADDGGSAHLAAARAHIGRHLADPSLSAARIAAAIGVSPRHLSRVFAGAGTSVPQYVLEQRLQAARAVLETPDATSMTIADVAHRHGFGSAAHFSHAFRAHFGERASEVRRRAAVDHSATVLGEG